MANRKILRNGQWVVKENSISKVLKVNVLEHAELGIFRALQSILENSNCRKLQRILEKSEKACSRKESTIANVLLEVLLHTVAKNWLK
jgi:hypothetical protein